MQPACEATKKYAPLIGRILLANIFLVSGFQKIPGFEATAGYMAAKMAGVDPSLIKLMLVVSIVIELAGGLMLLVGWQARWAATAIFLWMIPVTFLFHAYWAVPAEETRMQFIQFQKNLAIMGGLLLLVGFGSGAYSLGKDKC